MSSPAMSAAGLTDERLRELWDEMDRAEADIQPALDELAAWGVEHRAAVRALAGEMEG